MHGYLHCMCRGICRSLNAEVTGLGAARWYGYGPKPKKKKKNVSVNSQLYIKTSTQNEMCIVKSLIFSKFSFLLVGLANLRKKCFVGKSPNTH